MASATRTATAIGALAILLWSTLALVTTLSRAIPTFEALAITFGIGAVTVGIGFLLTRGPAGIVSGLKAWPAKAWLLSVGGIFVYHALYFVSFRLAPAGPVTIINYLWPLLIVIFAGLIPGGTSRLGWPQIVGGLIGFGATAMLIGGGDALAWGGTAVLGYGAAFACAFVWSLYSVLNNRLGAPGSEPMIGVCAIVAVLGAIGHVVVGETFVMPDLSTAIALLVLGVGPVGAAFVAWDHATKKGDVAILGAMSYATPPLSMILLVLAGQAPLSWRLALATALVVVGAIMAAMPGRAARRHGRMAA
ncbi:EamA family transporter [Kaistia dalseonensis]|uniref:Drug/metabolite transporter (DMT)-like permease n=1 Tax=Kaistia dalseonensis TaxID=410840 RepID=A0ABU0H5R5_9HYPH|nr:EamA family transporter [Kaistia dalseonensis]MCX5495060.1 EamA family transporter [Kaistia dalseonensis]MDQ0437642.1 drug/metabolite transporter (DMT)-like permease [Kaistia dalseonensis]